MDKSIKVSVLVISYNEIEYIKRTISSILNQNLNEYDIEIIIGDDGSDDGSIEYIQKLCEQQLEHVSFKYFVADRPQIKESIIPSIRVSNNLKRALELSSGEYITCLSADDYYCDINKLRNAIVFLDDNPKYTVYVTGYKKTGLDCKEYKLKYFSKYAYLSLIYIHISCFVFKKCSANELLERFCDDIGFEYSLGKNGKWKFDKSITVAYTQHSSSIMHSTKKLELYSLDIMLYQDIINDHPPVALIHATRARLFRSFLEIFKARKVIINDPLFKKYISNCSMYENDFFSLILAYDNVNFLGKIKVLSLLFSMLIDRVLFHFYLPFAKYINLR